MLSAEQTKRGGGVVSSWGEVYKSQLRTRIRVALYWLWSCSNWDVRVMVRRIHRSPVNSPHKWPVTRKMFPFDDVIMPLYSLTLGDLYALWGQVIFKLIIMIDGWGITCEIALSLMSVDLTDDKKVNIGSGNGLVPTGNKPLLDPMLTQISVAILRH